MRHLTDTFVEDPKELFSVHQTLVGKVLERHEEDQKVTMSAKLKDVQTGGTEMSVELTKSIFRDFAKVRESATTGALSTFMPGLPTTCTVTKSTELGIFVDVQVRHRETYFHDFIISIRYKQRVGVVHTDDYCDILC